MITFALFAPISTILEPNASFRPATTAKSFFLAIFLMRVPLIRELLHLFLLKRFTWVNYCLLVCEFHPRQAFLRLTQGLLTLSKWQG